MHVTLALVGINNRRISLCRAKNVSPLLAERVLNKIFLFLPV